MSEKRFSVDNDGIYDTQEKKHFKFIAYDWMECDIYECCEKLNEQQATISALKEENRKLRNIHLSIDLTYSYGWGRYLADVRVIDDE